MEIMETDSLKFNEKESIARIKKFLPAQAPLKDFIFQNSLKSFQSKKFSDALIEASEIFGYKLSLSLEEYRQKFDSGRINEAVLYSILIKRSLPPEEWKEKLLKQEFIRNSAPRIGALRQNWKTEFKTDMDSLVHPTLFRMLCSYLDQGISVWNFPNHDHGFLNAIREMEQNSYISFFKTERPRRLLKDGKTSVSYLLKLIVGDEQLFDRYIFDQQFAHPGWSGLVSVIEDNPQTLLDRRLISLEEMISVELLLELDIMDKTLGAERWPLFGEKVKQAPNELFSPVRKTEYDEVLSIWQEAYEWSYYDQVLAAIQLTRNFTPQKEVNSKSFQAMFCIDDREFSLRTHLEKVDPDCETFGTPGFFNVEFYYKPKGGHNLTKLCPAPVTPKYVIKELTNTEPRKKEVHFNKGSHGLLGGYLTSQTLGFWSAIKLVSGIFKPSIEPSMASSFMHMNKISKLSIVNKHPEHQYNNLQVGFTVEEMATRVEGLLMSIGLIKNFAHLIYVVGHGGSSANNPFYTTMDCGACSCRPGSVNARVFSFMANHEGVRKLLAEKGIHIPYTTHFVGGLHDTTRDDVVFFDEETIEPEFQEQHKKNLEVFTTALNLNAKERSRRFDSVDTTQDPATIHEQLQIRSVSIFETRPELDHATTALCIVGRRALSEHIFLDRRAFLNSYDYKIDPSGIFLFNILKAATPVCGDINLNYYFSKTDNNKLGAGSKLPHNVMGLMSVANGIEGDLRPGLPAQMVESHESIRLLMIVEHFPEIVLNTIQKLPAMFEYYQNDWVKLVCIHPSSGDMYVFEEGKFAPYEVVNKHVPSTSNIFEIIEKSNSREVIPVYINR
jgi:uncharacterized protein YbcC (UPF0753/DUF2309 family)